MIDTDKPDLPAGDENLPEVTLAVPPGSPLETLLAQYGPLKAEAEAAKERFDAVNGALKAAIIARVPRGTPKVTVPRSAMWDTLVLQWVRPWHFKMQEFKKANALAYVQFAERKGRWELGKKRGQ